MSRFTAVLSAGLAVTTALALSACAGSDEAAPATGSADDPVRIGVVNSGDDYWTTFTDLAQEEGISVELVNFSDYQLPNQGLTDGDLDLNQFQHLQFLANYNTATGSDLTPIAATAVYPLGLYSLKHDSVEDIPDGGEIAIPNDDTNQARALLVLQEAGLLALRDGGTAFSTPADVLEDESRVTVTPVDAAQTALALQDVDASIINNDFVGDADLTAEDAIFSDDPDSSAAEPYINVWVARGADADNEVFQQLVEIYHSPEVTDGVIEASGGTGVIKDNPASELQEILAGIQEDAS
ncbi:MetQ/NlpA family ABC transporter substrate-binding protein [Promicromonospora thailandica]|uniref:D-methionine transport system substrate-binding protein n=1 Tax=Promicromonospora thailandica TaxID=765201 RepID=A0A9X2G657_9MICO|nr:MetQ/NlpA family ABC transporter substrate-binding protein [Promicromonospora thailandica]MCP2266360.1 D-methionine transport system substrate-binding protein [Promicromonospora thailandica]BFF20037.1 MetQ/NlpA family ABC transporter substrate-binding protein [Promicromonospora thailandica]